MKKLISFLAVVLLAVSFAFAGGSAEQATTSESSDVVTTISNPITIEFWHSFSGDVQLPVIEGLVKEFNDTVGKEKGITVVPVAQGSGPQLYSKVIGAIKAGDVPAVAMTKVIYNEDYVTADASVDLTPYINDSEVGITDFDDFFPAFQEESMGYSKEGIYSLPLAKNVDVVYYNADFFAENGLVPPRTWDELEVVAQKIYDLTGRAAFGYDNLSYLFQNLCYQYGGAYTNNKGDLLFLEDNAWLEGVTNYADKVWAGIWRTAGEDYFFSGPFARQTIMMYVGGTVESTYINMKGPEFKWSAAPIPQANLEDPHALSYDHVIAALSLDGYTEETYAAWEFIKFITSTEASLKITTGTAYMATRNSVLETEEYKTFIANGGNDALKAATQQKDFLFYEPAFTTDTYSTSTLSTEITTMMKSILENHVDPQTAMDALVNALK
ncbi:MAG: extracellular solute-binding protein [Spirochaetales bacterium]|nr:extracellular solute-binding protein [Spirochaetales bacterium]